MNSQSASISRILVVAVLLLSITCAVLVGVLIWRAFIYERLDKTPNENPLDMKYRFPGYFRTPQEQQEFESVRIRISTLEPVYNVSTATSVCYQPCQLNNTAPRNYSTAAPNTVYPTSSPNTTTPNLGPNQFGRRKRQIGSTCSLDILLRQGVQLTYHVCCVSYGRYEQSQFLPSAVYPNVMLQIAQAIGNLFQYFETETCCQVNGCSVCQCEQTHYVVSAVIKDSNVANRFYTDLVRVPGCCKCTNRVANK